MIFVWLNVGLSCQQCVGYISGEDISDHWSANAGTLTKNAKKKTCLPFSINRDIFVLFLA